MADPRLNSVHLDAARREDYRRAREGLLHARGYETILIEQHQQLDSAAHPNTLVQNGPNRAPTSLDFWLMDKDYIYPLKIGLNTVGRSPDNDVVVQDGYVSRRHCAVLVHKGKYAELHDLASKNGTYLNGQKIHCPTRLKNGDEIRMCDRQLTFVAREGAELDAGAITNTISD